MRPENFRHSFSPQKIFCRFKEFFCNCKIINALEESKKSCFVLVKRIMIMIDNGGNSSDDLAIIFGKKKSGVGMFIERIFLLVDEFHPVHLNRRHPVRIGSVNIPKEADEF